VASDGLSRGGVGDSYDGLYAFDTCTGGEGGRHGDGRGCAQGEVNRERRGRKMRGRVAEELAWTKRAEKMEKFIKMVPLPPHFKVHRAHDSVVT
jgi:hypothetical protein